MRSCGQSETTPSTEAYTHHDDLYLFLQALRLPPASLVGLSNYGVALDFAIAFPELTQKLVLVSPGLRGYEFRDPWVVTCFAEMIRSLEKRDLTGAVEVFLNMWLDGPHRTPKQLNTAVREEVRKMAAHAFPMSRSAPNSQGLEPPAIRRLSEVRASTLVVLGDKDASDIHRIGQLTREGVAGSQLVTIPDVGHTLNMEKPEQFNRVVADFLQR
jgi:3-oxoadipate enol-lactonase